MKRHHLTLLLLLSLSFWILPSKAIGASFRTICFFPVNDLEDVSCVSGKQLIPVDLPSRGFSKSHKYNPENPIVFARPGAEGNEPIPLITVKPPSALTRALLIFLPASKSSNKPCRVIVLDDSLKALRAGEMRFINLSSTTVWGYLGERKFKVSPKKIFKVKAPRQLAKDNTYYVNIFTLKDKKRRPLCKTRWPHDSETRQLIFIFNDPRRKSIRMMGIDDSLNREDA